MSEEFLYIQDLATKHSTDITKKSWCKLIDYTWTEIKTVYNKKPTETIVNVQVKRFKKKYVNEMLFWLKITEKLVSQFT